MARSGASRTPSQGSSEPELIGASCALSSRGVAPTLPSNEGVLMVVMERAAAAWIDGKPTLTDCYTVKSCC